jgi:hypothetical protein
MSHHLLNDSDQGLSQVGLLQGRQRGPDLLRGDFDSIGLQEAGSGLLGQFER